MRTVSSSGSCELQHTDLEWQFIVSVLVEISFVAIGAQCDRQECRALDKLPQGSIKRSRHAGLFAQSALRRS